MTNTSNYHYHYWNHFINSLSGLRNRHTLLLAAKEAVRAQDYPSGKQQSSQEIIDAMANRVAKHLCGSIIITSVEMADMDRVFELFAEDGVIQYCKNAGVANGTTGQVNLFDFVALTRSMNPIPLAGNMNSDRDVSDYLTLRDPLPLINTLNDVVATCDEQLRAVLCQAITRALKEPKPSQWVKTSQPMHLSSVLTGSKAKQRILEIARSFVDQSADSRIAPITWLPKQAISRAVISDPTSPNAVVVIMDAFKRVVEPISRHPKTHSLADFAITHGVFRAESLDFLIQILPEITAKDLPPTIKAALLRKPTQEDRDRWYPPTGPDHVQPGDPDTLIGYIKSSISLWAFQAGTDVTAAAIKMIAVLENAVLSGDEPDKCQPPHKKRAI